MGFFWSFDTCPSTSEDCTRLWKSEIQFDGIFEGLGVQPLIPVEVADKLPAAAELLARREEVILTIARSKDFSIEKLKAAIGEVGGDSLRGDEAPVPSVVIAGLDPAISLRDAVPS